ncbi:hypothetical protein PYK79_10965 [Streptomyces sp. ID05-04B]|uniref:hypothetical protein n=1 Tax=Streptomyces sp. ID05-04B TaxID=3028661 RepID=UPI0029C54DE3|nr:hypothetical protein [Streptomyces sp. ID05-04B]MDX5563774.1 hypothetical protein [Streptomyces sp. ID05-04B]
MTRSAQGVHRDLAAAVGRKAVRDGQSTPTVRGSDWKLATVTAVNGDGTVDADGIEDIRRQATYGAPLVGDLIRITQSSTGNWMAVCPAVPAAGDAWLAPSLTSPWANFGGGFQGARYRRYPDGDVSIEGVVGTGATSVSGTSAVFTLPSSDYFPLATQMFGTVMNGNVIRQLTINNLGQVRFVNLPAGAVTFININCRFSTL